MVQGHMETYGGGEGRWFALDVSLTPQSPESEYPIDLPTSVEWLFEWQGLATTEILIRIRSRLDRELAKVPEFRSRYYNEAFNYLGKFRKELFTYLDDGELPIDNNLAERTIRKLTTQRNNSFHYRCDVGAEMAATYHSVISTVKLHGHSVWDFIGSSFKRILKGCRDYVNMVLGKIGLASV